MTNNDTETAPRERVWRHTRKGLIHGIVVKDEGEWLTIRLTKDHYNGDAGDLLAVRTSYLTEVTE